MSRRNTLDEFDSLMNELNDDLTFTSAVGSAKSSPREPTTKRASEDFSFDSYDFDSTLVPNAPPTATRISTRSRPKSSLDSEIDHLLDDLELDNTYTPGKTNVPLPRTPATGGINLSSQSASNYGRASQRPSYRPTGQPAPMSRYSGASTASGVSYSNISDAELENLMAELADDKPDGGAGAGYTPQSRQPSVRMQQPSVRMQQQSMRMSHKPPVSQQRTQQSVRMSVPKSSARMRKVGTPTNEEDNMLNNLMDSILGDEPAPPPSNTYVPPQNPQPTAQSNACGCNCGKQILGNFIKAMGKTFNTECFVCTKCRTSLVGVTFYPYQGKMFCQNCYTTQNSVRCSCGKQIIEGQIFNVNGKTMCQSCFVCVQCMNPITSAYRTSGDKVFCAACHSTISGLGYAFA